MKTNGFKTGNVLRDLFMQSHLHGYEFMDLVCSHFHWSQPEFKEKAKGVRLFSPDDMHTIIRIQKITLINRNQRLIDFDPEDYDHNVFK